MKDKVSEHNKQRFEVVEDVKHGLLMGHKIYDNEESKFLPFYYDCDEYWLAKSKADFKNELHKKSK